MVETLVDPERFEFRSEQEYVSAPAIVERFLPCTIPRQRKGPGFPVPQTERKHPVHALQRRLDPPFGERGQHDCRITMAAKFVAMRLEVLAKLRKTIDLAVVCVHIPSAFRHLRLCPGIGQVYDGEPRMHECQTRLHIGPHTGPIRSTVMERSCHACHDSAKFAVAKEMLARYKATDSTHGVFPLLPFP